MNTISVPGTNGSFQLARSGGITKSAAPSTSAPISARSARTFGA